MLTLRPYIDIVQDIRPSLVCGKVKNITGLTIEVSGPDMRVGDLCYIS